MYGQKFTAHGAAEAPPEGNATHRLKMSQIPEILIPPA